MLLLFSMFLCLFASYFQTSYLHVMFSFLLTVSNVLIVGNILLFLVYNIN